MDQQVILQEIIASGLAYCTTIAVGNGGLIVALLGAGLVGGLTHCVGMCGPFVLSQVAERQSTRPANRMRDIHRITGAALLPYHLGRATTYVGLGSLAALFAGKLTDVAGLHWISATLLLAAAGLFLAFGLERLGLRMHRRRAMKPNRTLDALGGISRPLFANPRGWRGYTLGLFLGFIPCGLLYGAIAVAAASGDPLGGAFAMAAFAVGTMPALFVVGAFGSLVAHRWRTATARLGPALMIANAGFLTVLAWRWIA